jgi:hypothetical protein
LSTLRLRAAALRRYGLDSDRRELMCEGYQPASWMEPWQV